MEKRKGKDTYWICISYSALVFHVVSTRILYVFLFLLLTYVFLTRIMLNHLIILVLIDSSPLINPVLRVSHPYILDQLAQFLHLYGFTIHLFI